MWLGQTTQDGSGIVGMQHSVRVVADHQLPGRAPWAFVTLNGDETFLLIAESTFADPERVCELLTESWAAWNVLGKPLVREVPVRWYQRRRSLAWAPSVAAALVVAVPSPVAALYHG